MSEQNNDLLVTFDGNKKITAHFMGFDIKTDQSVKSGGDATAAEPFMLFLSSIATCAAIYVLSFVNSRNISTDGISVRMRLLPDLQVAGRIGKVELDIEVPPTFPEKYHKALVRAANGCAVKKYIQNPFEFGVQTVVTGN